MQVPIRLNSKSLFIPNNIQNVPLDKLKYFGKNKAENAIIAVAKMSIYNVVIAKIFI